MSESTKRSANAELWHRRVAAAESFPGSMLEYCRREGISRESLRYWRKRLGSVRSPMSRKAVATSAFARVEVLPPEPAVSRLPDARWVAELIFHLQNGVVR